jgi:hypothetical protein
MLQSVVYQIKCLIALGRRSVYFQFHDRMNLVRVHLPKLIPERNYL